MKKTVVMFAGQGSQYQNMGLDFLEHSKDAKLIFDNAAEKLDFNLLEVLNSELINDTKYTQSLVFLTSAMIYEEVKKILVPDAVIGFSLGEYSAYYASDVMSFNDTLEVVKNRSKFMAEAADRNPGSMAAIIGISKENLEDICNAINDCYVTIANYNEPKQLVISGNLECVNKVCSIALEKGARRAIPLNVSGAFHSELMIDAGKALKELLNNSDIEIKKPKYPIWLNVSGEKYLNEELIDIMEKQVFSPVLFYQAIEDLIEKGYNNFIEIGPGKVLSGLVKKINRDVNVINVSYYEDLEKLKEMF